jgi:hypothetical protein
MRPWVQTPPPKRNKIKEKRKGRREEKRSLLFLLNTFWKKRLCILTAFIFSC